MDLTRPEEYLGCALRAYHKLSLAGLIRLLAQQLHVSNQQQKNRARTGSARAAFRAVIPVLPLLLTALSLQGQEFYPLSAVHSGLRGVGRTVFSGDRVEEFQVEVLGVLRNPGPKQSIILARLSGGPLADTGILQGMSGSPVYIDGKLLGAVALGFPFSKQPIAGIQPIENMLSAPGASVLPSSPEPALTLRRSTFPAPAGFSALVSSLAAPLDSLTPSPLGSLTQLLTPLSMSGFTPATLQAFSADFRRLGFEPLQALSGGPPSSDPPAVQSSGARPQQGEPSLPGSTASVVPGSMISVGLLSGDLNITADGTVTYVSGNKVYAFGHRFLNTGTTDLPFAHSDVVALIPSLNSSFKLSAPQQWVGSIRSDRATAISGEIGRAAETIPLTVNVRSASTGTHAYHFQLVNDRFLTPFVAQTALFSILDATERTIGSGTVQLKGRVEWQNSLPPLEIQDTFISDSGLVQQVSTDAVVPLAFVLGAGFRSVRPKSLSFDVEANESKRQLHIAQAWTSAHDVRAGTEVSINVLLQGENGVQFSRSATYKLPIGTPSGPLNFTVSDGNTLNYPEFAGLSQSSLHSPEELIQAINRFRNSESCYVRVWRQEPSFTVSNSLGSGELTDPPPSIALVLSDPSDSATSNAALTLTRGSQVAELSFSVPGYVITGAKTLQVEVKE